MHLDPIPTTAVIGLGSPLMGDDGLGLVALERLRPLVAEWVEVVDGGTWGLNLLPTVERADRLLLLDAVDADLPPGSLVELQDDAVPRYFARKLSPHEVDLRDVLALAMLRGGLPGEIVVLGIQPDRVEMGTELSPSVKDTMDRLINRAAEILTHWGTSPPLPAR